MKDDILLDGIIQKGYNKKTGLNKSGLLVAGEGFEPPTFGL